MPEAAAGGQPGARRRPQRHHLPGPAAARDIPLVRARDWHERTWLPPSPLLFQRWVSSENRAITSTLVASSERKALARSGLTDPRPGALCTARPADFRRMFITDAVRTACRPIAQVIAGHQDIACDGLQGRLPPKKSSGPIWPSSHAAGPAACRKYRIPTDEEWAQFLGRFERRKVATGTWPGVGTPSSTSTPASAAPCSGPPSVTASWRSRQPDCPDRRSPPRGLGRRGRRTPGQPRWRRAETRPDRQAHLPASHRPGHPASPDMTGVAVQCAEVVSLD
jgi:hypothetical protein